MIIYLHGFNSRGNGDKCLKLKDLLKDTDIEIHSPTYDSADFDTIDHLMDDIVPDNNTLFIGSSLGGFIAMYLAKKYNAKCILLNPATDPLNLLKPFIGKNTNFYTNEEYDFTLDNLNKLKKYYLDDLGSTPVYVFVNADDELIDYRQTISFFKGTRDVKVLEHGGHIFVNLEEVIEDILLIYG